MTRASDPIPYFLLTGVESTGKTTLSQVLAQHFHVPLAPEMARLHPDVVANQVTLNTLQELLLQQNQAIQDAQREAQKSNSRFCLVDTGPEVLHLWSVHVWGACLLPRPTFPTGLAAVILCPPVLPWVPDPLRTLPNPHDRWKLHGEYVSHLITQGTPFWTCASMDLQERVAQCARKIEQLIGL
jgi:nicotinamide riboside kinase